MRKRKKVNKSEQIFNWIIAAIVILSALAVLALGYSVKVMLFPTKTTTQATSQSTMQVPTMSRMSLTSYDKELALQMMDKNEDGRCDSCGMPVEMCIDSGQLQCNMDSRSTIGVLGSQHIHADWKIYINGKEFDWSPYEELHEKQMMGDTSIKGTSAFIHIHPPEAAEGDNKEEKAGDVLHMHATGVPLWLFFESIGMKFTEDCIEIENEKYCNDAGNNLKFYVNGKPNGQYGDYVFNDLDKILISYGIENDLSQQMKSITDFVRNH